ncbi:MAG: hypothetical protein E6J25_09850 [Chloroflexi bacterium]|nr:MAG: hypothetical protein E6J25_09850 [Chloroflexota bacterium]
MRRLVQIYEQVNASFGQFGMDLLTASTKGVTSADDSVYASKEGSIESLTGQRDALASKIKAALSAAAFDNKALNEQDARAWIAEAQSLLDQASALAAG